MDDGGEEGTFHKQKEKREDAYPWENTPCAHEEVPSAFASCMGGRRD